MYYQTFSCLFIIIFIFFAAAIAKLFRSRFAIEVDGVGEVGVEVEGGVEKVLKERADLPLSKCAPTGRCPVQGQVEGNGGANDNPARSRM